MHLPEFSVRNSIFGNMLTIVVLVVGMITAVSMNREFFPEVDFDIVVISTPYPNASAREVENQVTIPLEDELRAVEDIEEFTSRSVEHSSVIALTIDPDAENADRVINDIARKVDRVRDLPDEAEDPVLTVITSQNYAIHLLVGGRAGETAVRSFADHLKVRVEAVDGVSIVERHGWRDPEIWVEADAEKLIAQEISLQQVSAALARQNINSPGGKLPDGPREIVIRTIGQFRTPREIEDVVVRSNPDGKRVRVRDIAVVRETFADEAIRLRNNGSRGVLLSVQKKDQGDTIDIADRVKAIVEQERETLPEGIELAVVDMEAYLIKRRLNVLLSNGMVGLVMVLLSLPLLMNLRIALVTALGIPFAFLSALLVMASMGISINMMTMFGIILVVGMLVDDAIIIAENIFRHLEDGLSPKEAAIKGSGEVMWPVTATVLTTIAAFFPLMFLPDIMGKFLRWIPAVVIITLAASLFEALLILPCHIADLAKPVDKDAHASGRSGRLSAKLQDGYGRLLQRVLHHRILFVLILVSSMIGSVFVAKQGLRVEIFPADLIDLFQVNVTMPQGTALDATENTVAKVEAVLRERLDEGELSNLISQTGHISDPHGANVTADSRYGMLLVYLAPADRRERSAQEMIAALRPLMTHIGGVERIDFEMVKPGPPVGKPVDVKIVGRDYAVLDEIAGKIGAFLSTVGAVDVHDDHEPGKDELRLVVDKAEAARLGLDVASIAQTVYTAFQGIEATVIRDAHEETKVRVKLAEPYRDRVEYLQNLRVPNHQGRLIELSRVVRFEEGKGVTGIYHVDGERVVSVYGEVDSTDETVTAASIAAAVGREFGELHREYPGYRLDFGGEFEETQKTMKSMIRAMCIALLLIFAILVVQFRSFLQPFTVLVSIPFGLIGVIFALILHGKPLSMMAMLGMVGMAGVVVNDAIVLVSFINGLRRDGMPVHDAILEGARKRVRPILLTSVTTVLGLAPVIYGIGGYEPFVAPAAIVLAYGLVFATFLTLLVVPCMYSIGADIKGWVGRRRR
ncbi:MAG: efflux RND transporter permease subunit [Kiritimatiellia bacterium]|jgi:multidrug efflux pump subunit AcrB|nr:efflux RND transporter permease subunit [Kiritimatiellia bacterium]MDP6809912.1 efflux RND transporter permease subunit [Kiritimatiellia bacterium]MDP7024304.1 efflux RND transporter permease subunit [Kiritimatiellia bacterium]